MKRLFLILPVLLLIAASLPAVGELPKPETLKLENGLTVFIRPDNELPLVAFRLLIRGAGTADDPSEGVADLTATLLLKGAAGKSAAQMAEELDFLGATLRTGAQKEYFEMTGSALSENFPRLLALAADCLTRPAFTRDEFEKERLRRLDILKAIKDDPSQAVRTYFSRIYFGSHPFGKMDIGANSILGKLKVEEVLSFYQKHLRPEQAVMAVVGNIQAAQVKKLLSGNLGKWKGQAQAAAAAKMPPLPLPKGKTFVLIDKPDATQAYFMLGVPGIPIGDSRVPSSQVMNTLFGGRFTSWINTELRIKRGLTYGARSSFESWRPGGIFTISSYTKNDKIGEMLDITFGLVAKARKEGFTQIEIESARNYILGQFPPTLESLLAKARSYTHLHFYGLGFGYYVGLLQRIGAAGLPDVNEMASRIMPENDFVLVVVGKAAEIRQQLAKFGEFKEKKISDTDF